MKNIREVLEGTIRESEIRSRGITEVNGSNYVDEITLVNEKGELHADNQPAVVNSANEEQWWKNGKLHREDGPAITNSGGRAWYLDGLLHRTDGPAIESGIWQNNELIVCRSEYWFWGKLHREEGPAVIEIDGSHEYWLRGECIKSVRAD